MTRTWMTTLVIAGGLQSAMFGQQPQRQYPQQYPPQQQQQQYPSNQSDPNYNDQYDRRDDRGQYSDNQGYDPNQDSDYDDNYQGVGAPPPPPMQTYSYRRPQRPGPGYLWVDGYWNFLSRRYSWVSGYWMLPPYAGSYWIAPRYSSGHYFRGYWGASRGGYSRGYVHEEWRDRGHYQTPREAYRGSSQYRYPLQNYHRGSNSGFRSGDRGSHYENGDHRSGRR